MYLRISPRNEVSKVVVCKRGTELCATRVKFCCLVKRAKRSMQQCEGFWGSDNGHLGEWCSTVFAA